MKYKAKLIGETNAQPAPNADNGFLKNAAIAESKEFLDITRNATD